MPLFSIVVSRHQTFPPFQVEADSPDLAYDRAEMHWRHYDDAAETDDWQLDAIEELDVCD